MRCLLVMMILLWAVNTSVADSSPNVIYILSDDQGYTDYGFMGHPHIKTPHIDRLAKESLTYTRGYVPDSLCRPSLATIISGRYPHKHRIVGNDPPTPESLKGKPRQQLMKNPEYQKSRAEYISNMDGVPQIQRILRAEGYATFQSGKWWEGSFERGGFENGMTHGDPNKGGRHGDEGLKIGRDTMQPVLDFMTKAQADNKPFYLWYAPMMPHTPHNPPEKLLEKYKPLAPSIEHAKYWAMCEWFDESIGTLLNYLDQHQLAEDTIIVYVCDNGWIQTTAGDKTATLGLHPKGKRSPYEGGIRTPIMFRWKGHITPEMNTSDLVSSVDLTPTTLSLLKIKVDSQMDGINLTDKSQVASRDTIFGTIYEHDPLDMTDPRPSITHLWVIHQNRKLILPNTQRVRGGMVQMFDLQQDPQEEHNLADQAPADMLKLKATLTEWWPEGIAAIK
jgi:uncharacterized sulfatase